MYHVRTMRCSKPLQRKTTLEDLHFMRCTNCMSVSATNSLAEMFCRTLNRVTEREYSDTTPEVEYTYKTTAPGLGSLVKVESSVSTTEYTGFDILGRVTGHKQTTDGEEYSTGYVYNLSGAMVEQTYPSGRVVKNVIDGNGDLSIVQSRKNASHGYWNYANSFTYNAAGAVTSMQLGNGRWESTQFNSRLQPTQIALGATNGATNLLKLDYSYGTTANNGNVMSQTITVPTVGIHTGFTAVQNYTYDSLNRLESATENVDADPTPSWKQAFTYDRYGNRNFDEANTIFAGFDKLCNSNSELCADLKKILNPSINPDNNRLNTSEDYDFDDVGNTTEDPQGRTFIYDAENKQVKVKDHLDNTIGEYQYDGDGRRVKKIVPNTGEVTIFVYDAAGKSIAEYSTTSSNDAKVSYTTADHLGSPRILTDEYGQVISRRDFHPFGEEIYTPDRTANLGYQPDDVRQKFTNYERDIETDLDFAQSRYYAKNIGRFNSADEPFLDQFEDNPQSWNLYLYVRNNPVNLVDPFGTEAGCPPEAPRGCYERGGKYYIQDEKGNESEYTNEGTIKIETSIERGSDSSLTLLTRGPRWRFTNPFVVPMRNLGSWGRELWRRFTGRPPAPPQTPPNPPAPNNVPYGPPSPPLSLRQEILQGRRVRGKFPKQAAANEVLYRMDGNGNITHYQRYDSSGRPLVRVDLVGASHGGIPTPHVLEYNLNLNPQTGRVFVNRGITRPANPSEIP